MTFASMDQEAVGTHVSFRQRREFDPLAIFDDGSTTAVQIDYTVPTFVHSELPRRHDENTAFHTCHMSRTVHMAAHY